MRVDLDDVGKLVYLEKIYWSYIEIDCYLVYGVEGWVCVVEVEGMGDNCWVVVIFFCEEVLKRSIVNFFFFNKVLGGS